MKHTVDLPKVGSVVHAYNLRLVSYDLDGRRIAAEANLLSSGEALTGKIPLDEISPYDDLDPAAIPRSKSFLNRLCWTLLLDSDLRFLVIDRQRSGRGVVLSHRRLRLRETTVAKPDDKRAFEAHGFRSVANLHYHLLKHPFGLGGDEADWPSLLANPYDMKGTLKRLKGVGCPAARQFDGVARRLVQNECRTCPIEQKLRCFPVLRSVRTVYEEQAVACIDEASELRNPRHYHYQSGDGWVMVFMDAECGKVVAKGGRDGKVRAATFYQPDDCYPALPEINLRYFGERRRMAALSDVGEMTVCNPAAWGF